MPCKIVRDIYAEHRQANFDVPIGELLSVASTLRTIRTVKEWHSRSGGGASSLDGYFSGLVSNKFLEDKITSAIISEEEISDKASPVLLQKKESARACLKGCEVLDKLFKLNHSPVVHNRL